MTPTQLLRLADELRLSRKQSSGMVALLLELCATIAVAMAKAKGGQ